MKKNSLFFSAAITTFILAVIGGIVKARATGSPVVTDTPVPTNTLVQPTDTLVQPTLSQIISPQEASVIAASVLGSSDLYSVDTATLYGMDVYKVTFSSGNIVYVSPEGHVLLVTYLRRYVTAPSTGSQQPSGGHSQGQPQQSGSTAAPTPSHHDDGGDDSGNDH
ncbi:MAG TPA: hypothetical protein VMC09_14320 [Anaerolineales bacterium]|nr:hypothetical protein [Anaerolineales bacterium]